MKATDIRIDDVTYRYEDFHYRTPIKFGGTVLNRVTLVNVEVAVHTEGGKRSQGHGSMPLGNVWSFPSKSLSYEQTLAAMKAVVDRVAQITRTFSASGHPIDLTLGMEHEYLQAAEEVSTRLKLTEAIPILCTLVCASPFDAALHDAYGKVHGLNSYGTYGPDFMNHDLGHYLGNLFTGETLDFYVRRKGKAKMPLYHLIGAADPLEEKDLPRRIDDGLPETLGEWIAADGLTHLKIKLSGEDLAWDVERMVQIDRVATAAQHQRGMMKWVYSLDFNEKCADVHYVLEFIKEVQARCPEGFARIQYIEQPTARDLQANRHFEMNEVSRILPVVIDESLIDQESLLLAREMGYTGAALKACKGQTQSLLMAAAAQKNGMFLCVQDLTCPGASLIQSAGLAAHIPGIAAIESNARQYCPQANQPWEARFPGIFKITDGTMATETITGPGLGAVPVDASPRDA